MFVHFGLVQAMAKSLFRAFFADRAGTIAIFSALLMPIVVGGFGLGGEASYWYFAQRKLQNAADVAAYAAAAQLRTNRDQVKIDEAVLAAATKTGYKTAIGTVVTNWPAVSGVYAGDENAVEIILRENHPRLFTAIFASGTVPISSRAVAHLQQGFATCILALDRSASGAVTFTGSSDATLEGCNVHANSTADDAVTVSGGGIVNTPCVSSVGEVSATSGLNMSDCAAPIEYAEAIGDPFSDVPEPSTGGACEPVNNFAGPPSTSHVISAGRYCGGLTIKRNVTMNPGVYVVDGGSFTVESTADLTGADITLYLTNGATVSIAGTANINLSAPVSGDYKGILVFVDRHEPDATHIFNGSSSSSLDGAIYAASSHVVISGTSSVGGGCTQVVANTVEITGDAGLGGDCASKGFNEIMNQQLVKLVE